MDLNGIVVTRCGHSVPTKRIEIREARHPVPDQASVEAANLILGVLGSAGPNDLVLALISGGGSSLMTLPVPPLTLEDKIAVNRLLLESGLPIAEMNLVRRRLSAVKAGGLLRAAAPARLVKLAISDVPGDDPVSIASGPTVPDPDASLDISHIVKCLGSSLPERVR